MDLLSNLNPNQRKAATHQSGPALVLAGAGSGKTKVLTTHAAWLIQEKQVDPKTILLVTFTNKAALEMRQRLNQAQIQPPSIISTFHSFSARMLRHYGEAIQLSRNFVIYDSDDSLSIIKNLLKKYHLDKKRYLPRSVRSIISNAKNELLSAKDYANIAQNAYQEEIARLYRAYQKALTASQAVDFDDLLILMLRLLESDEVTREELQHRFNYVLIDEYQDTNKVQYRLTKLLTQPQDNLFVVGDFSQSIYAWRGADYHNMLKLKHDFPQLKEYRLEQNYRSSQTILNAATAIISKNKSHPILKLWTNKVAQDENISLIQARDDRDEASRVVQAIKEQRLVTPLNQIAILYRTNAQSRAFEEKLIKEALAYHIVGGTKFYERKEIKDLISYLRLMLNPYDEAGLSRATKNGKRKLNKLLLWQAEHPKFALQATPSEILEQVLNLTQYQEKFKPEIREELSRLENIEELGRVALNFQSLSDMLENIALIQDDYMQQGNKGKHQNDGVQLMSLHTAKGLEFEIVFLVGVEDGLLPHAMSLFDPQKIEEERRLCYVGITRAKKKLYLSYTQQRYLYGRVSHSLPSRFLFDIDETLLDGDSLTKKRQEKHFSAVDENMAQNVLDDKIDLDEFINF